MERVTELLANFLQNSFPLSNDFWTNPVTGQQNNMSLHRASTLQSFKTQDLNVRHTLSHRIDGGKRHQTGTEDSRLTPATSWDKPALLGSLVGAVPRIWVD